MVNRIYGGFGLTLFKGFSAFGIETDFLFGNIQNNVLNIREGSYFGNNRKY